MGTASAAQPQVGLGTADSFAVLAGSAATNTGPSTINGDLGVTPGTSVTGFGPPATVNGTIHAADAVAAGAQSDLTIAYDDAAGRIPALAVPTELGGLTLTAGVYKNASSLGLTGALTLDAQGDPDAVFIFQAGSTLTTASASRVNLINGAQPCNVFWQVGSSATLGTSSVFTGNILALTSISMNDGVRVHGRALARNGAVTLINDTITRARCAPGTTGGTPTSGGPTPGAPSSGAPSSGAPSSGTPGGAGGPGAGGSASGENGTALFTTSPRAIARTVARSGIRRCVDGRFRAVVTGLFIRRVVFSLGGRVIATRTRSPFTTLVRAGAGVHRVSARVTFRDGTPAATLRMRFRACAEAARSTQRERPRSPSRRPRGPFGLTG
ncbi:MAG TPA: ice-binding family protein [Solirubrobacteraceae bacterium]|nr:ice-binding family protein [Solirubrobacteraceae bacterium]